MTLVVAAALLLAVASNGLAELRPRVEVEEVVAPSAAPNNGAGPLWCYGAPLLVRRGDVVFASVMEAGEGVPPLCNTRWVLFRRGARGWRRGTQAEGYREREPCPLVLGAKGRLLLSANPSTQPPGTQYGPCQPTLLEIDPRRLESEPVAHTPRWTGEPVFTDHSYRGIAADRGSGDVLLLNIDAHRGVQHWSYRDASGAFRRSGEIAFPIRACYPQVALRGRAAHVMAIGDIVEPREEWRAYKREKTGSEWDYVFRRLFYTWTPDLNSSGFRAPLEVESVESTGGHILNLDLWLGRDGAAHLLYLKTNTQPLLRDRFFPELRVVTTLEHVVIREGRVESRETLVTGGEDALETPRYGRFHADDRGRLHVVYAVSGARPGGRPFVENRLLPLTPNREGRRSVRLDLKEPFTTFFTATERGGSRPSRTLDLFGLGADGSQLRYARIRLSR